jgi:hypothetical protein
MYMPIHLRVSLSDAIHHFTVCHDSCCSCIAICLAYATGTPAAFCMLFYDPVQSPTYKDCHVMNVYLFSVYLLLLL